MRKTTINNKQSLYLPAN